MLPPDTTGIALSPDEVARFARHLILPEVEGTPPHLADPKELAIEAQPAVPGAEHLGE